MIAGQNTSGRGSDDWTVTSRKQTSPNILTIPDAAAWLAAGPTGYSVSRFCKQREVYGRSRVCGTVWQPFFQVPIQIPVRVNEAKYTDFLVADGVLPAMVAGQKVASLLKKEGQAFWQ